MTRIAGILVLIAVLAGCASQTAQCRRDVQQELAQLDRQIAQSREALRLGYREELIRPRVTVGVEICGSPSANVGVCADTTRPPQRAKVAIDPAQEQRALNDMLARRADVVARADRDIAQCAAS
ncbi:hypothetical protein [Meridianimarinicoccus aquatilis]|uniref:Excinuclease ABC subunit B n=1 Tax=Meridianimarinicoccus aquatilis TaxID=2552766 RepID=A0A4V3BAN0_9RHOB|nr:hypothetical protein [Fluviibacterium aquatile]QIE42695.1 hypothetical protein G5B39_12645 [Rhodobacteraceae bacterium SC52]TDL83819.1 hypothetical protein E2L05_19065 [Fluviibacterium aquatile]